MSSGQPTSSADDTFPLIGIIGAAFDYMTDAAQRTVLFWDVMRQRGNAYHQHVAQTAPHVLNYQVELVVDGRELDRSVNYALVRVIPPKGTETYADTATVCCRRSACRPRPRHRRVQGRQRNRRRVQGRSSLLFHRLPARSDARSNDRRHRVRRGDIPRTGDRATSRRPTASPASSATARPAGRS